MQPRYEKAARTAAATAVLALAATAAQADTAIYTSSNSAAGNSVLELELSGSGNLDIVAEYATGGFGTDSGLGNQGAIAIDDEFLFVVDAGSNELSAFRIEKDGLAFADRVDSGGVRPVSVTVDRDIVYVVNAGSDSIAGFTVDEGGRLEPIAGSVQALSGAGTGPAQISFSKGGRTLIVSEKATNSMTTFTVDRRGVAGNRQVFPSPGATPFGFALTKGRRVLVSEAAGGAPGQSSVTAWKITRDGMLDVLDPVEPTLQTAACWVAVTPDGRFAYTTNTGSNSITAYRVEGDDLLLADDDGLAADVGPGSRPIDMVVSGNGRFLHTLNAGTDSITTFRIGRRGDLEPAGTLYGLPANATGLAFGE